VVRASLPTPTLATLIESFLISGDIERHTVRTLGNRRERLGRVVWLAQKRGWQSVGVDELKQFFLYLRHGHLEEHGRFGEPDKKCKTTQREEMSSGSVKSYYSSLRTFFRWCVAQDELDTCPMDKIPIPVHRDDQIQTFTDAQVSALIAAAKKTRNPRRDEAILTVFADCGLRVSELCALRIVDADFGRAEINVRHGKGDKGRHVPFGRNSKRALWNYLQMERKRADENEPLFISDRGIDAGAYPMTPRGVSQLIERIGTRAKITGVRCSCHDFRHYFAISMLRNGANIYALKRALGHESLHIVQRYLALSQADLQAAHRLASPMDRIKESKGGR
jgi:integrase/recombinase XerD